MVFVNNWIRLERVLLITLKIGHYPISNVLKNILEVLKYQFQYVFHLSEVPWKFLFMSPSIITWFSMDYDQNTEIMCPPSFYEQHTIIKIRRVGSNHRILSHIFSVNKTSLSQEMCEWVCCHDTIAIVWSSS